MTKGNRGRKRTSTKAVNSGLYNLYIIVAHSFVGKIAFYAFITFILILAAIIASRNQFDLFFKITGAGLLLITVVSWLVYLFSKD
ncbi:MAG: hypothetical protein ACYC5K_14090 [Saccharofermentanales bacterium]